MSEADDRSQSRASAARADADYEAFVRDNLRRNFTGHFLHGMLGMTGFRIINAPTFIPAYIYSLSGSSALVGLAMSLQQLGSVISPIFGASILEHRKKILPVSIILGMLMRFQLLGLAIVGWFFHDQLALVMALIFLFLFGLCQGPQRVAFQLLMGKVIPVHLRGRLNAWRNIAGGSVAAILSWLAGDWLIANHVFGNGYATTFFFAFVITSIGLSVLQALMREPEPPTVRTSIPFLERVKEFPTLLRADKGFAWFMVARSLAMGIRISWPFFFLYAAGELGADAISDPVRFGAIFGMLTFAYMAADTLANLVWGYLADRSGFRSALLFALLLNLVGVTGLIFSQGLLATLGVFAALGAAQSGYLMSTTNIVMEFGHRHDLPMRMAFSNTAEGLTGALAPLFGGLLVLFWGYHAAFAATLTAIAFALIVVVFKVDEPRLRKTG
mgnify:FL=1